MTMAVRSSANFVRLAASLVERAVGTQLPIWKLAIVVVVVVVAVSLAVMSKRAVRGDPRDLTLRRVAHRLIGRWGTQFVDADLTGADFSGTDPARAVFGLPLLLVTVPPAPIACRVRTAPSDSMRLGQPVQTSHRLRRASGWGARVSGVATPDWRSGPRC